MPRMVPAILAAAFSLAITAHVDDFVSHRVRCDERDMEYAAYTPGGEGPRPVLILLHGAGDQAGNFIAAWKSLARKKQIVLIAPQLPRDPALEPHIPKILPCLVDDVRRQASLDSHRIYLFGYSMGGYLAYDGALIDSEYFAAAAIHAMGIADEYTAIVKQATRKIPIHISIGDEDRMVSISQVRKTRDLLKKSGFPVQYEEIPNHTHNYYEISGAINDEVWRFLEPYRLP